MHSIWMTWRRQNRSTLSNLCIEWTKSRAPHGINMQKHAETIDVIALCRPHGCVHAPLQARRYAKGFWYHRWISGGARYFGFRQCFSTIDWEKSQEKTAMASWPVMPCCSIYTIYAILTGIWCLYWHWWTNQKIQKGLPFYIYIYTYNFIIYNLFVPIRHVTMATKMDAWITFYEALGSHRSCHFQLRSTCAIWPTFGDWHQGKSMEGDWGLSQVRFTWSMMINWLNGSRNFCVVALAKDLMRPDYGEAVSLKDAWFHVEAVFHSD